MMRRLATVLVLSLVLLGPWRSLAASPACLDAVAAMPFPDESLLEAWNQVMSDLGPRPTASAAHRAFIGWLRHRMRELPGVRTESDRFAIRRQLERSATLEVDVGGTTREIPTAGPIPYAVLTDRRGVVAPLVDVPAERSIGEVDVRGRIVVRDHEASGVPYAVLQALASYLHDPGTTLDPAALYERDYLGYQGILGDLRAAMAGGAAGLVVVHEFPRDDVLGHYEPYEGISWAIPALYLGADEGRVLRDLMASQAAGSARIAVTGGRSVARTQNLIATLAGGGPERIVIASHTDGMNAVWDNGPIAMLALARWFAGLPLECRPRTLEFAFSSAHLYLSQHGAHRYAAQLQQECDTVALAIALEHLGAREYVAVPRTDGPGRALVPTGQPEFVGIFVTPGAALRDAAIAGVTAHDLRRHGVLPFIPGVVSGEAGSYQQHGLPTIGVIAGPWSLYNPSFGMEAVDVTLLRRQALAVRDVVLAVQDLPRDQLAGGPPCVP